MTEKTEVNQWFWKFFKLEIDRTLLIPREIKIIVSKCYN